MKQALDVYGLKAVSSIIALEDLEKELNQQIQYSKTIGAQYITTYIPPEIPFDFTDPLQFQILISKFKKIGTEIKRNHLKFAYHVEISEFEKIDGKFIFERILEEVGQDLLQLELDTFWIKKAGLDPIVTLLSIKNNVPLIHLKDMDVKGDSTEVGHGIIDWPPIFRILQDIGVKYYFVEQDFSSNPLNSVNKSLEYLKSIGVL